MDIGDWTIENEAARTAQIETDVPLTSLRTWCRIQHAFEDDLLTLLRSSSINQAEEFCKTPLLRTQASRVHLVENARCITLDGVDISDIEVTNDEDESVIPYELAAIPFGVLLTLDEPFTGKLKVEYESGFAVLPNSIKMALMYVVNTAYNKREERVQKLPTNVSSILNNYKIFRTL